MFNKISDHERQGGASEVSIFRL